MIECQARLFVLVFMCLLLGHDQIVAWIIITITAVISIELGYDAEDSKW